MTNHDLEDVKHEIDLAIARLTWLRKHVHTLHSMSFEQVRGGDDGPRGTKQHHYGDEAGSLHCRREWHRLRAWLGLAQTTKIHNALLPLVAITVGIERLLAVGRRDDSLRGSTISPQGFEQAKLKQRKRGGGRDRLVDQPKHPSEPQDD